jgi:ABC-type transporter Mla maintaining outer membrane lipid asymmetry ATPase subunit MlaF
MAELRCDQIFASYGQDEVLSDVDLIVPDGTLTAILGASGSGKTTLLRVIMGFIAQQRGTVSVGDRLVSQAGGVQLPPEKRSLGYVAQEGALYPHLTVAGNVPRATPSATRTSCPAASSVASPWPARWRPARRWSCLTSRSLGSTPRCAPRRAPPFCTRSRRREQPLCS